ncbi:MAG: hypothetical protein OSB62_01340 [Alphaproteobacteria bacterium]|nr:hypothetical protein [Alphaproteobacteria bacterium]
MGDSCDPNNCARCDKYAAKIASFKEDISKAPHFNESERQQMLALFDFLNTNRQRSVVRGYALFQKLKDERDLSVTVRKKIKEAKDYQAFAAFYKTAR